MEIEADHSFEAPVSRVIALYADPEFCRQRGLATGATESEAAVDGDPTLGFTVTIRRTMPTDGLQPEFRPFIGPSISVRYSEVWQVPDDERRSGTFALEIVGAPVRASGTLALTPDAGRTLLEIRGDVTAQMPFLGNLVAQAVVTALLNGIEKECSLADSWLAKG